MLNTKIPPPIVFFAAIILVFLTRDTLGNVDFPSSYLPAVALMVLGFLVAFTSVRLFKTKQTTVNPMKPEQASSLVTDGAYVYTRNPMYLGMLLVISGTALMIGSVAGFVVAFGFTFYIQVFQIIPEEKALDTLFGEEYQDYCKRVRRWI